MAPSLSTARSSVGLEASGEIRGRDDEFYGHGCFLDGDGTVGYVSGSRSRDEAFGHDDDVGPEEASSVGRRPRHRLVEGLADPARVRLEQAARTASSMAGGKHRPRAALSSS